MTTLLPTTAITTTAAATTTLATMADGQVDYTCECTCACPSIWTQAEADFGGPILFWGMILAIIYLAAANQGVWERE
ncbi:hypothetical protein F4821DRAFT_255995 [Hypoxylon rubiginosum]|uniref:Uncharacterized protein n=1 Tax=Hypoxylon rubiginosum TaxID=110542 RepID=A0ACC0DCJ1_9PEZI|nr:hypothetical protein F4821DRAFT_255995 [Hypoxylon rubiginosum]